MERGRVLVLGSGTSEGVPRVSCLTAPNTTCKICHEARTNPKSKNRRRNTSIAINLALSKSQYVQYKFEQIKHHSLEAQIIEKEAIEKYAQSTQTFVGTEERVPVTIVIDVGKFFYHSAIELFPTLGLRDIDAILITHDHFDCVGGLDDLRDWTKNIQVGIPLPIYSTKRDFEVMVRCFPYLLSKPNEPTGGGVPNIDFVPTLRPFVPINLYGIEIIPLPVFHGKNYVSLGFRFGDVVYISDCNEIPLSTTEFIIGNDSLLSEHFTEEQCKSDFPMIEWTDEIIEIRKQALSRTLRCKTLIIDCLSPNENIHPSHFQKIHAIEYLKSLPNPKPEEIYFTGMCHTFDHELELEDLQRYRHSDDLNISVFYDGFCFSFA